MAIFAPLIAPGNPSRFVDRPHQPPSSEHWLGTTGQGQDVFVQVVWGSRISLFIGFTVGILTTLDWLDHWNDCRVHPRGDRWIAEYVHECLPAHPWPSIADYTGIFPAARHHHRDSGAHRHWLGLVSTSFSLPDTFLREKDFVSASVVSGENTNRIVFSEILPNMLSLVVSSLFGSVAYAIASDAGLAFLGFENVNNVSWGTMLYWASNNSALLQEAWWTFLPPGLCIALVSFATTMLIYAMDEITNPRLRSEKEISSVLKKFHIGAKRSTPVVKEPGA